jgi:hypothetical protein
MKTTKQAKNAAPRLLTNGTNKEPAHDEIARRAYSLWEQQGWPQGQETAIWLLAETELRPPRSQHAIPT